MASQHNHLTANHPPVRIRSTNPPTVQPGSDMSNSSYNHEETSWLCARFIIHSFACPEFQSSLSGSSVTLRHFIKHILDKTNFDCSVAFTALALLQRLKSKFPAARGSSGHRLFVSAFLIASKVMVDNNYGNSWWSGISQGMFPVREINQLEREMCGHLEWELNIDAITLQKFGGMIRRDFANKGPYPTYVELPTKDSIMLSDARHVAASSSTTVTVGPYTTNYLTNLNRFYASSTGQSQAYTQQYPYPS